MPVVVVSHSQDLWNPFGFPSEWPLAELEREFQDSQDMLTGLVPGTRHSGSPPEVGTTSSSISPGW